MFITREDYKSPVSAAFSESNESMWSAVELALQQSWFLVQMEEFDPEDKHGYTSHRTVLLVDFKSIEHLLHAGQGSQIRIKSVHIVTPGFMNGSNYWQMDQLRAVWQGREKVGEFEIPMDIFETVSGQKFPATFCRVSIEDLAGNTLKYRFSH